MTGPTKAIERDKYPPCRARDPADLRAQIMDPNIAKNDAEWWAQKHIATLEASHPVDDVVIESAMKAVVAIEKDRMGAPYCLTEDEFYENALETVQAVFNTIPTPDDGGGA